MGQWYSRPVLFVADVTRAVDFYVSRLGFSETWRYADDVAQVSRDGCEIIVSNQQPAKTGSGMLFVALTRADFAGLPDALEGKGVTFTEGHWGYPVLIVDDPDGNQLFFPAPDSPGREPSA